MWAEEYHKREVEPIASTNVLVNDNVSPNGVK